MLTIISPAKTLNFDKISFLNFSNCNFYKESYQLVEILKKLTILQISKLMNLSDKLSSLNHERFVSFVKEHNENNAKQAIFAYRGDVYNGIDADNLEQNQIDYLQNNLRIISGLYGVLRPLDLIQPYRLEMSTKLVNKNGNNLYKFWQEKITKYLNDEIENSSHKLLINLASEEYSKAIDRKKLQYPVIDINFKEYKNGSYKIIMLYAKKARGLMANYMAKNNVDNLDALKNFNIDNYEFNIKLSKENEFVFTR